jgi:hypothetical protein
VNLSSPARRQDMRGANSPLDASREGAEWALMLSLGSTSRADRLQTDRQAS